MDNNHDTPLGFWGIEAQEVLSKNFPIHKACLDGDAATLSRLCAQARPEEIVAEDQFYSWPPIHWAAYFGKNECVLGLLQFGVGVNLLTSKFQQTPAHIAAFGGHPDTLLGLLKAGADYQAKDYMGEIPLHKAARVGNVECVKQLINNGTHASMCNNEGLTAGAIARNLNFIEVAHLLEIACSQLPNPHHQMQVTNGFHLTNGTSGSHISHMNGHTNGMNGHVNGSGTRKRTCADISMPVVKRARMTDLSAVPGSNPCLSNGVNKKKTQLNGFNHEEEEDPMDCYGHTDASPITLGINHELDDVARPPSPGMDMRLHREDDLQLWGYYHGYGDTAECIEEEEEPVALSHSNGLFLRGTQARGWR